MGDVKNNLIGNTWDAGFTDSYYSVVGCGQAGDQPASTYALCAGDYTYLVSAFAGPRLLREPLEHAAPENISSSTTPGKFFRHTTGVIRAAGQDNPARPAFREFSKHLQYQEAAQAVTHKVDTVRGNFPHES